MYACSLFWKGIIMRKYYIYPTLILLAAIFLWTQYATATETQQLYDKAVLYKEMYHTTLEVGLEYCFSKGEDEEISRYFPLYLGILYYEMGEWEKAIQNFENFDRLPNLQPEDKALSKIRRGMALFKQGGKNEAIKIWKREIGKNEENPKVRSVIGYAYARADYQLDEALALCQASYQESPDNHLVKRNLGWAYFKIGDIQKARELLDSIALSAPDFVEKNEDREYEFYDAAILLHLSHLYFKIVSQVEKSRLIGATAPKEQLLATTASYELGEYETAVEHFQKLAEQNNQTEGIIATIRLGACYYKLNQPDKARQIWDDIRQKMPNNREMLSELGRVYSSLKINPQEAEALCIKALPNPPEKRVKVTRKNYKFYRNLGWVYLTNGKYEEAINVLSQTRNLKAFNNVKKNGPLFFLRLANCYYRIKNFTEAVAIYGALSGDDKASVQIHEMVNLIWIVKGKPNDKVGF